MEQNELIPHLFRTEYRKIISVLCKLFGMENIEVAEDIASDTFLRASETWGLKGLPENPTAWLYKVSKNKAIDVLKHNKIFIEKIALEIKQTQTTSNQIEIDLSNKNINDSQLEMMFAVCNPCISVEAQIGLSLNILCGFGVEEIADAFLTNKETIYKRLARAKEKLRTEKVKIKLPSQSEIDSRLEAVLTTLYLLFSEGYYSTSQNTVLRKDLCLEAIRLNFMLVENEQTNTPSSNALLSLMCFNSSRFEARKNQNGDSILYEDQDSSLWSKELIEKGVYYLNRSSTGRYLSKFHLEAAIAYWHTHKIDTTQKWENILQLYNRLLQTEYSAIVALNRTYAFSKTNGVEEAIIEAEKLELTDNHFYYTLLGELYKTIDKEKSKKHFLTALSIAKSREDRQTIQLKLDNV
ncbi:MAG: RNA polymerase sigma factor (sigma-70 family) [Sediminicola sp.]|jgi:RNA polymerase sigma factor (sigma-70 family)